MKILTIVAVAVALVLFLYLFLKRPKVAYEVHLFVQNNRGEVLLIYDQRLGRFVVPYRQVAFDEIPTKVIHTLMTDLFGTSSWDFDYSYHFADNKYDRIRDDTGPVYVYDVAEKHGKRCVLCYVLNLMEYDDNYNLKKEYPYPEFYTRVEMEKMGEDITPPEMTRYVLQTLMDK